MVKESHSERLRSSSILTYISTTHRVEYIAIVAARQLWPVLLRAATLETDMGL